MTEQQIRFEDGVAYEQMMGIWSRLAGDVFLDWLAPPQDLRWIDIGCGNGCFTELLVERCAPAEVQGIDPSAGQLAFARERSEKSIAAYCLGDAEALPFSDDRFDAATMALVIFFLPNPVKGIAEMIRVVRPGGIVAAYAWDMLGGGFPLDPLLIELRGIGATVPVPPSAAISQIDAMKNLWIEAGLGAVATREIRVQRTFTGFDEFWNTAQSSSFGKVVAAMPPDDVELVKTRTRPRLPADGEGRVTYEARANAITGRVPQVQ